MPYNRTLTRSRARPSRVWRHKKKQNKSRKLHAIKKRKKLYDSDCADLHALQSGRSSRLGGLWSFIW